MKITVRVTINSGSHSSWRNYAVEADSVDAAHEHIKELVHEALRAVPGVNVLMSSGYINRYGRHPDESSPSYRQSMRDAGRGGLLP